ncbi:glycosyltransferase family 2 protein [Heyndrickxia sp. NPDC080065]|uniref:glycosyltransferase family 2 protein n=1 Tax=Heyndrickxia sp. NPDC080065 TaxID=3390568 RepID=UPI003D0903AD
MFRMLKKRQFKKNDFNSMGYAIVKNKENKKNATKITVITPVYNAEKYLKKTIDSVINQSIGFNHIEYILVDDGSTDSSRNILLDYSSKFENIDVVFLKSNTGTPGHPRNIGIQLSNSKYITFLDADDWLEPSGLEILHTILEETGDDYIVGKTIQLQSNRTKIVGEHESCKERRGISPYSIPHIFQHLGPRARMIRASIIKDNHITFPKMKFAEDKQFFIDVLINCNTISTTEQPIYYLNRLDDNKTRLTKQTNIIQKTNCNLKVIKYVINKKLEIEKEKMILNRLYEFDSITRFFTTPHFQKTRLKPIYYYKFNKVLKTTKGLRYEFSENFFQPINKVVYQLFCERKYKDLVKLFEWEKEEKVKDFIIKDTLPYVVAPFLENKFRYIRIPMLAFSIEDYIHDNKYCLHFKVYGDFLGTITDLVIRNRKNIILEYSQPVIIDRSGNGKLELDLGLLSELPSSNYEIFLKYSDYNKLHIRRENDDIQDEYRNRDYIFYKTIYSNVGLRIK